LRSAHSASNPCKLELKMIKINEHRNKKIVLLMTMIPPVVLKYHHKKILNGEHAEVTELTQWLNFAHYTGIHIRFDPHVVQIFCLHERVRVG
jgi:hypothetical protein